MWYIFQLTLESQCILVVRGDDKLMCFHLFLPLSLFLLKIILYCILFYIFMCVILLFLFLYVVLLYLFLYFILLYLFLYVIHLSLPFSLCHSFLWILLGIAARKTFTTMSGTNRDWKIKFPRTKFNSYFYKHCNAALYVCLLFMYSLEWIKPSPHHPYMCIQWNVKLVIWTPW